MCVSRFPHSLLVTELAAVSGWGCCRWGAERSWSGRPGWVCKEEGRPLWEGRLVWSSVAMSSCSVSSTLEAMGNRGLRTMRLDLCREPGEQTQRGKEGKKDICKHSIKLLNKTAKHRNMSALPLLQKTSMLESVIVKKKNNNNNK